VLNWYIKKAYTAITPFTTGTLMKEHVKNYHRADWKFFKSEKDIEEKKLG
jgi:hypothetical protein